MPHKQPVALAEQTLRRMWPDQNVSLKDIAAALGCSDSTVTQKANRLSLGKRPTLNHDKWGGTPGAGKGSAAAVAAGEASHQRAVERDALKPAPQPKRPPGRPRKVAQA